MSDSEDGNETGVTLNQLELPFTTTSSSGAEVELSSQHRNVNLDNRDLYLSISLHYRLVI